MPRNSSPIRASGLSTGPVFPIILVTDDQLRALADPKQVLDLSLTFDKYEASLRQVCESAKQPSSSPSIISSDSTAPARTRPAP